MIHFDVCSWISEVFCFTNPSLQEAGDLLDILPCSVLPWLQGFLSQLCIAHCNQTRDYNIGNVESRMNSTGVWHVRICPSITVITWLLAACNEQLGLETWNHCATLYAVSCWLGHISWASCFVLALNHTQLQCLCLKSLKWVSSSVICFIMRFIVSKYMWQKHSSNWL